MEDILYNNYNNNSDRDTLFYSLKITIERFKNTISNENPMSQFIPKEIIIKILPTMNNLEIWLNNNQDASYNELLEQKNMLYKIVDPLLENIKKIQENLIKNISVDDVKNLKKL